MTYRSSSSWMPATRNGNYNQAIHPPSTHHCKFRYAVPANHKPVDAGHGRPTCQANAPHHIIPTVRRLLAEAHQKMFSESRRLVRDATAMDMILDHRLLISVTDLPMNGHHRSPVPRNYALGCQADIDAYWEWQEEMRGFVRPTMSKNIEPPVSAVRSTIVWPPNLDGDEVWDSAS